MKAIILAAGRGSRMKSFTDDCPKCLVEVHGKPLLEWQLAALQDAGITDIAIVTGYKRGVLANRGLVEFHNSRWSETNMVTSLECAADWLESEPCIVSYSDIFYESSAVKALMVCNADLAVTYDDNWRQLWERRFGDPLLDAEGFRLDNNGKLVEIGKKPNSVGEIEGQYMGLLRFSPSGWAEMKRVRALLNSRQSDRMNMTETLQRIIEGGRVPISALPYHEYWGEVDSVDDLNAYE